jgi:ribosome recycling factor
MTITHEESNYMIEPIKNTAESKMKKALETLQNELAKLRTGRAHPSLLDHVRVKYYDNEVPLSQVSTITVSDARSLLITPWEKPMIPAIEKAIMTADLGLNPATSGNAIRVPMPPLTEERRKEMAKLVKNEAENSRVVIRNLRRDANNHLKDLLKKKEISEDDERRAQDVIQKLTDKYIAEVDRMAAVKEKELMEV